MTIYAAHAHPWIERQKTSGVFHVAAHQNKRIHKTLHDYKKLQSAQSTKIYTSQGRLGRQDPSDFA
jgi:hypothetical protein